MLVLLGIGFVAGLITAVSPCVLPVLPIVLAGGATGSGRRPLAIVAGLVASFTLFTLTASVILSALGLPQDFLRNLAIGLVFLLGASLGLVFVPCAGPVLATITVLSAQHRVGARTVVLTIAYALGAAV